MNGFEQRKQDAERFQTDLFQTIEGMGFTVALNGTEHTHPEFTKNLHRSFDQTSLSIRFQPDGIACIGRIPRALYVEAKYATNIERLAYEQYSKLCAAGNIVVVVFGKLEWRWSFIEELRLVPAQETVRKFPPDKRFPVVDGWIVPRGSERFADVRVTNNGCSGTPYREVDRQSLREWPAFRPGVLQRLLIESAAIPWAVGSGCQAIPHAV